MQRKRASLKKRIAVQLFLAAGAALVGWVCWATWRETLLAACWENELTAPAGKDDGDGISAAAVNETIDRLLTLGRPGLAAVVRALGHPRDEVGRAAAAALDHLLDVCENGPPNEATPKLEDLAVVLADNVDALPVASRPATAKLAMRIVVWSQKSSAFDTGRMSTQRITAACDRVLRSCGHLADLVGPTREAAPATPRATETRNENRPVPHTVLPPDHSMYLELAELTPPDLPRADAIRAGNGQPRLLLATEAKPLVVSVAPRDATTASNHRAAGERENDEGDAERMHGLDALDLFARLHEANDAQAAAAELAERGFSPRQIEVGKHLLSHDAEERLRWAEVLPGIRGVDARFWLLRLSRDTNVQVRRSAIGLLATDRDPEVIRRLRQVAVEETEPEIRDQAGRALQVLESQE
jgi:hypothetical protein